MLFEIPHLMDVIVVKYLNISSIHVGSADIGGSVPLAEEHVASVGVDYDGPGSLEVLQEGPPVVVVLGGEDVERSLPRVDVVEILAGPVQSQALNTLILTRQDIFSLSSISFHLFMGLFSFYCKSLLRQLITLYITSRITSL